MLYLRLAWRNIWRHRRRTFLVILAMALCLMMMIFYDGFVAGFERAIYTNAVKVLGGNVQVHAPGYKQALETTPLLPLADDQKLVELFKANPIVVSAGKRIQTTGITSNREGAFPISIVAIEPEEEALTNLAATHISQGRYLNAQDRDSIFIGKGLAELMGLKTGDRITVAGRALHEQMRQRTLTVVGIYDIGLSDFEKRTTYISLAEGQDLYGLPGQSTEVAVSLKQLGQEPAIISAVSDALKGYEIGTWKTNYPELEEALKTKGSMMDLFSFIILMIVGIGIFNLLLMAVFERTREIGLMGALGMKPGQITLLFLLEGTLMGVAGVILGIALGVGMNAILGRIGFDYTSMKDVTEYMALINTRIYPTLGIDKLLYRSLVVLVVATISAFYPARQASAKEPAHALHYV